MRSKADAGSACHAHVVGFASGAIPGAIATDVVPTITEMLRSMGSRVLPRRQYHIGNMSSRI